MSPLPHVHANEAKELFFGSRLHHHRCTGRANKSTRFSLRHLGRLLLLRLFFLQLHLGFVRVVKTRRHDSQVATSSALSLFWIL